MGRDSGRRNTLVTHPNYRSDRFDETQTIAQAIFAAQHVMREALPIEVVNSPAVAMLLALSAAPDGLVSSAQDVADIASVSCSSAERWLAVLATYGIVAYVANSDAIMLTASGRDMMQRATLAAVTAWNGLRAKTPARR